VRNIQWRFTEWVAACDPLWFCCWHKRGLPEGPDEWRDGLLSGLEILQWMADHLTWLVEGEWDEQRYALPVWRTPAGREGLAVRAEADDMMPLRGGLVEPGYVVTPAIRVSE
jgi:hypothetical protein